VQRLTTTTFACYALLMFAGAGPLELQRGAAQTSAAATTGDVTGQDPSLHPEGAKRIAATHHQVDLD